MDLSHVLIAPIVTEKSYQQQDKGKYVFRIHQLANKVDVKNAIKKYFGSDAESVNISGVRKKTRTVGRGKTLTKRRAMKKAIVSFGKGVKLDLGKLSSSKK
jgi:large subunit ribosomal protein L23